ncbi:MAG: sulfotransferase [Gemmataceae bacterium]
MTIEEYLKRGLDHHRQGQLDQAEVMYRRVLERAPKHADALHFLGVIAHQRGQDRQALEFIDRALELNPCAPAYHCNRAETLRSLKRLDEAETSCRAALNLKPQYPEALHNLGVVLFGKKQHADAEAALRESLRLRPDIPNVLVALADVQREQGHTGEALDTYRRALELAPKHWAAHTNYGLLLVQRGELDEGLAHCRQAVELAPRETLPRHNLGRLLLEYGKFDEAMETLAAAFELDAKSAAVCETIATAWIELGDHEQAKRWLERALEIDAGFTAARYRRADLLVEMGDPQTALGIYQEVLAQEPDRIEALTGLAKARLELGDVPGSVSALEEALRFRPEASELHALLGTTLSNAGDLERAVVCQRKAIEQNPHGITAHAGLLTTLRGNSTEDEIQKAEACLSLPWMTDGRRAALHFGLAQAYDGHRQWERAAQEMIQANALQKSCWEDRNKGYDPEEHRQTNDRLIEVFSLDYFKRVRGFGSDSERPVFIVGMPRSGTTLTEQILSSHPQVFGAGERPFAFQGFQRLTSAMNRPAASPLDCASEVDAVAVTTTANWHLQQLKELDHGTAARIVDKLPDNYQMLGWLTTIFPKARFVHCRRDVRDVALSCWITQFGMIHWAVDLEWIADRILQYQRLMEHWRQVLPVPMLEIDYETMVADQETTSRRLIEFVGLDWDPSCLNFHQTKRLVRTASVAQVREPIYTRSVARWQRYEAMLAPLLARLDSR